MSKEIVQQTKAKITDFKRFSFVLLSLGAFLYLGSLIPFQGKEGTDKPLLMGASFFSVGISLFFYRKIAQWKKQLNEHV